MKLKTKIKKKKIFVYLNLHDQKIVLHRFLILIKVLSIDIEKFLHDDDKHYLNMAEE
jgi:hypothetical protein